MKYEIKNEDLIIHLQGQLNSFNAEDTQKEIISVAEKEKLAKLVLDFDELKYISSAGIRIIMLLKQKYNDLMIINVNDDINDIFTMVSLDSVLTIKRK